MAKRHSKPAPPAGVALPARSTRERRRAGSASDQHAPPRPDPPAAAASAWEWPFLGVLFLAPILAGGMEELPAFALDILIFLALVLRAMRVPFPSLAPFPGVAGSALALLGLALLSMLVSVYRHATLAAWVHLAAWLTLAGLCADAGRRPEVRARILAALLAGSGYVVVRGMQEYLFQAYRVGLVSWRTFATFLSPNLLAAYLECLIPLTLALYLRARRPAVAMLAGFLVALQVGTLFVTGSRGGLLALAGGLLVFVALAAVRRVHPNRADVARAGVIVAVMVPLLLVVGGPITGRIARSRAAAAGSGGAVRVSAEAQSNRFRVLTWRSTWAMVRERPLLGYGLGTWRYAHPRHALAGFTRMAHQSYLQLAAEIGVPGLLAFLTLLGATALALVRAPPTQPGEAWLLPGLTAGLTATGAHNLIDYSWYIYGTALPFWALLGLVWALAGSERAPGGKLKTVRSPRLVSVVAVLLLALAAWLGVAAGFQARAEGAIARAFEEGVSSGLARLREAESLARTAAALAPLDAGPWMTLGRIYRATARARESEAAYESAARRAPTWSIPLYRLGEVRAASGQAAAALEAYQAALERDPNSTQVLLALAELQVSLGRREAARASYERIVAISCGPAGTVAALDQMRDHRPAEAHDYLGRQAEEARDLDAAVTHYRAAAVLLQARRRDLLAGGMAILEAAGQLSPETERKLTDLERRLWDRLASVYDRRGDAAQAAWARKQGEDAEASPLKLPAGPGSS